MFDENARRRLGALGDRESAPLDAEARGRIAAHTRSEGPRIVRRARIQRTVTQAAWLAIPSAAIVLLAVVLLDGRSEPPIQSDAPARAALSGPLKAGCQDGDKRPGCARACAAYAPASGQFVEEDSARRVLDLGALALVSASADAETSLIEAAPCRTVLSLTHGRLTVHARELGGGELVVRGDWGTVQVRGTIFVVDVRDELSVEVAEGQVDLTPSSGVETAVRRGRRVVSRGLRSIGSTEAAKGAPSLQEDRLEPPRVAEILREVGMKAASADAAPPRTEELAAAESTRAAEVAAAESTTPSPRERARRSRRARRASRVGAPVEAPPEPSPAVAPEVVLNADQLVRMAEQARRSGQLERARGYFMQAGAMTGATAEGAWIGLAKLELKAGRAKAALAALDERKARFERGVLGPEASWIEVGAAEASGDLLRARRTAIRVTERWPSSEQARAAREWLDARE